MPDVTLKKGGSKIVLKVNGLQFYSFNNFRLSLNYNSIASTFSFDGFFDINNQQHKALFKPLQYQDCVLEIDGRRVLTGTILNFNSSMEQVRGMAGISGYTKTGILEDVGIPPECYPLQNDGLSLKQIAEKLCKPFGISVKVTGELYPQNVDSTPSRAELLALTGNKENVQIPTTSASESDSVKEYLTKLAKANNLILTHDAYGNLVITKLGTDKKPIATFTENKPSTMISLSVNGQGMHSNIKMVGQSSRGTSVPVEGEVINPLVKKYRPITKRQNTGDNTNTESAGEMALGSELRNIYLTITTPDWYWTDGQKLYLILPNECISVHSPNNYMSRHTKWFVESVDIRGNSSETVATIKAVLPEVYTGKTPQYIFT